MVNAYYHCQNVIDVTEVKPKHLAHETMLWECRRRLLATRGMFGFGAIGCYFFAVTKLPLNDTMVLTFLAPLVVALASPVVIKENPPK